MAPEIGRAEGATPPSDSPPTLGTRRRSRRAPRPPLPSAAEIEAPDLRIAAQDPAGAFGADPTHRQNIRPLTQRERLARVLLHEEDAEPARVDLADALEHEALERRREPRRRLVEQEHARLHH